MILTEESKQFITYGHRCFPKSPMKSKIVINKLVIRNNCYKDWTECMDRKEIQGLIKEETGNRSEPHAGSALLRGLQ